ncbi:MAG: hypothetical protein M1832_002962 [Thelocarpon impressellum]|nr:MAG: hypothetical protein M1832_002962 [Thelocarpon impressellum]
MQPLRPTSWSALALLLSLFSLFRLSLQVQTIQGTDADGNAVALLDSRKPALFTRNFGDCLGSSIVNVTRFDAAYYADNMTVLFHLGGSTGVRNESLMMHIGVFAYGESRFDLTFNPCNANIDSLCPMERGVPIEANGIIPVAPSDVANIPAIALAIPDFEGQAILRIFANSTETEIGCFSAVVTNGKTFSQPAAVGTVVGLFAGLAVVASFATAVYGDHLPTMRKHHAHSLSVFVVFAVLQHVFFTGALSMNWPSVLPAFWSNFAWAGGMIYSERMQNSINAFLGSNLGNTSYVGAASSGSASTNLGGGVSIQSIYRRSAFAARDFSANAASRFRSGDLENMISRRDLVNATDGYSWYGQPVKPGMPLPGNFSGFAGTLSVESIPASNAFMTGLLWLLILVACIAVGPVAFKWILEGLSAVGMVKKDRLAYFRAHWIGFTQLAVLRTLVASFFMMIFLTLFQSSYKGAAGVTAIAALIFVLWFVGTLALAGYACFYRLRFGHYQSEPDRLNLEAKKVWKVVPWLRTYRDSDLADKSVARASVGSMPWWRVRYVDNDPGRLTVHEDEDYIKKYGWLAARFRRTRWWFFAVWLIYEFVRACFYGGAAGRPATQVFGLLVVEVLALVGLIILKPFEGARLNALVVYALGFSKVAVTGLSAAFDTRFNLPRITTTAIGIVIIVIQGVLTAILMIAIVVGVISSYMSLTRNRETFRPASWAGMREKYFRHMDKAAADLPPPPPPEPQEPVDPYFSVSSVRRCPKIEDEDEEFIAEINDPWGSKLSLGRDNARGSRRNSVGAASINTFATNVPWGARVHRASWSTRDFENHAEHGGGRSVGHSRNVSTHALDAHGPSASTHSLARVPTALPEEEMATVAEDAPGRISEANETPETEPQDGSPQHEQMSPVAEEPQLPSPVSAPDLPSAGVGNALSVEGNAVSSTADEITPSTMGNTLPSTADDGTGAMVGQSMPSTTEYGALGTTSADDVPIGYAS